MKKKAQNDLLTSKKEPSKTLEGTCEDCVFSVGVKGEFDPILTCRNKAGGGGRMWVVDRDGRCENFTRDKEILAHELAAALAEGARLIPLTQDKFAVVDAADCDCTILSDCR